MVEQPAQPRVQIAEGAAPNDEQAANKKAEDKRRLRETHQDFLQKQAIKKQEVVMKFKRSNDAVLTVFTPDNF